MADPRNDLIGRLTEVQALRNRGQRVLGHVLDRAQDDLDHSLARVRALSPLATLRRGYAVLSDAEGALFSSVEDIAAGAEVTIRVADGRIGATVNGVQAMPLPHVPVHSDLAEDHDD
jgi:exodeoxyribonuclease VII large subunit